MTINEVTPGNAYGAGTPAEAAKPEAAVDLAFSDALKSASGGGKYDLDAIFEAASRKYGVSVDLLKAVAKAESNFIPDATSRSGAMGIMQLMPGTAQYLGVTDAYDPEQNIMGGANLLRQFLDKYDGDVRLALAAYNAGPGNVAKYGGVPPFNETQNYVKNVLSLLGGESIYAGSVTYGSAKELSGEKKSTGLAGAFNMSLPQMLLMRIIEMQMSSSSDDKDKKKVVF
ncbi:MAG: lytic transglycosylase domain-containing protein [Oscillospiraceae bacterium]|nr:lytic transglycosylase domain-containing protein [Oscillospiraceae bacterium]